MARLINQTLGGYVVGPWDVGQLDETTLDLFWLFNSEVPAMRKGMDAVEQRKAEIMREHRRGRR